MITEEQIPDLKSINRYNRSATHLPAKSNSKDLDQAAGDYEDNLIKEAFERLLKKMNEKEQEIKEALTKSNTLRSICTILITFFCTLFLLMLQDTKHDIEFNDYKTLQKIFGGYNNAYLISNMGS